jgi:antitoxin (DNA-binding transcriptional repressor) of toxin-antitoxin stability system
MNKNIQSPKKPKAELLLATNAPSYAQTMTRSVDLGDAAKSFAVLAEEALAGEEIIFSQDGKPVMKLVALSPDEVEARGAKKPYRKLGAGAKFLEDFDWEQWEQSDKDLERVWKKFGHMS